MMYRWIWRRAADYWWVVTLPAVVAALAAVAIASFNPVEEGAEQAWGLAFAPAASECPAETSPLPAPEGEAKVHADTGKPTDLLCDHPVWRLTRFEDGSWQGVSKLTGESRSGPLADILR